MLYSLMASSMSIALVHTMAGTRPNSFIAVVDDLENCWSISDQGVELQHLSGNTYKEQ